MVKLDELESVYNSLIDTESKLHSASTEYLNMRNSLKNLIDYIKNPDNTELDSKGLTSLALLYTEVISASKQYENTHIKHSHSTQRGAARIAASKQLSDIAAKDAEVLMQEKKRVKKGTVKLEDIFQNEMESELVIKNPEGIVTAGAHMSQRIPIKYKDGKNVEKNGYFTVNEVADVEKELHLSMDKMGEKFEQVDFAKGKEFFPFDKDLPSYTDEKGEEVTVCDPDELAFLVKQKTDAMNDSFKTESEKLLALKDEKGEDAYNIKLNELRNSLGKQCVADLKKLMHYPEVLTFKDDIKEKDRDYWKMAEAYAEYSCKSINIRNKGGAFSLAGIRQGSSLTQKNVAMSSVANLLGAGDVISKSEKAVLDINGKKIEGVVMEEANGYDIDNMPVEKQEHWNNLSRSKVFSPKALQQISRLQIMDYICGNTDRHLANMIYDVKKLPGNDYSYQIDGIKGIDNDNSFGVLDMKEQDNVSNLCNAKYLNVIDFKTSKKILNTSEEELKASLGPYQLSKDEIDSAVQRFNEVKKMIQEGKEEDKDIDYQTREGFKEFKNRLGDGKIHIVPDAYWSGLSANSLTAGNEETGTYNYFGKLAFIYKEKPEIAAQRSFAETERKDIRAERITANYMCNMALALDVYKYRLEKNESFFHSGEYKAMNKALNEMIKYTAELGRKNQAEIEKGNDSYELNSAEEKKMQLLIKNLNSASKEYSSLDKNHAVSQNEINRKEIAESLMAITERISSEKMQKVVSAKDMQADYEKIDSKKKHEFVSSKVKSNEKEKDTELTK